MAKNKSFNKLMAGTMTAAMVAGVVAPVATAAEESAFKDVPKGHWSADAINSMAAKGIIVGIGDGLFGFGDDVTRAQVATFMVKAKGIEPGSTKTPFTDVPESSIYAKFIAAAEANKIMAGLGDNKFGPDEKLTRAQMAQLLVNAYGFKADENNKKSFNDIDGLPWATAKSSIETLASLGIVAGEGEGKFNPNGVVTREQAAQFIYNAMNYHPEVKTEAKVESVSAINAQEIKVTFTNPVNEKTAVNEANYIFKQNGSNLTAVDFEGEAGKKGVLSKDGKSVTFKLVADKAFANSDKYAVHSTTGVLGADLKPVEKYLDTEKTFSDSKAPELLGARVVGNAVELTFNKPVKETADVKIDGVKIEGVKVASKTPGVYTLTTATIADKGIFAKGDHEVVVYDAEDTLRVNANKASILTTKYTVSSDTTAPEVKSVKAINNRSFKVTFSEPLSQHPEVTVKKGNYTFPTAAYDTVGGNGVVQFTIDPQDATSYIVSIKEDAKDARNPLYASGEKNVDLSVNLKNFKDTVNLLGKPVDMSVSLTEDTATPKVSTDSLNKIEGNNLLVKFNGKIVVNNKDQIVVRDKDGVVVTSEITTVGDVLNIKLASAAKDEPYTVEVKAGAVKFAKDENLASYSVNTNSNVAFNTTVSTSGIVTPVVEKNADIISIEGDVITVNYGQDMSGNAKDVENYKIDGKALPAGTTAEFVGSKQIVKISLPKNYFAKAQDAKFTISTNVLTSSGSKVVANAQTKAPVEKLINFADNTAPKLASAVYVKATNEAEVSNTIKVTFDENIKEFPADDAQFINDLKVVVNGNNATVKGIKHGGEKEKNVVYLTTEKDLNVAQAATISVVPKGAYNPEINITDAAGNKLSLGNVTASTAVVAK
ncbi:MULTISPECIES: S-layer homology domain-containing protein [Bacillus cereus group]|uniref:S-layer homology domain-containing protein n=1 Tax=Bacillus cereus group TaxID=86661 RepID=UPI0022E106A5|nr:MULTISPECIES: S-layer homology domain-containing protein [unclassified Bacillus cereus group]MDA2663208.1 S-layer homology domain-containing protein [Bacillus cereus group sp. Bc032]MDA2673876.1 S-layer homology domain-containing protein [Bacillus cereus group sp. Bc031]MDA2679305.1 S-layer homology domain-containing protein [Bacillus cereus group sp. Bc029]MDA2684867.1 S-layer homology domain-containing protein [Bacillus cereus group sp. Bc030]MDA2740289.1 S-layer homology domain-containin